MLPSIDDVTAACGIIIDPQSSTGFRQLGTAWQVAPGEWLTAWLEEDPPPASCQLLAAHSGAVSTISSWEQEGGIAGFRADAIPASLEIGGDGDDLSKRQTLIAVGYPSVIAHPAFAIHRGSLDAERYHPYLCPWIIEGHLALYTKDQGWLAGVAYHGMVGSPVLNERGKVVGLLSEVSDPDPSLVPLASFKRIAS